MKMDKEDTFLSQCTSMQCESAELEFQMLGYIKDAMKAMELMRFHKMLTDVVLEVGTETFHAHRVILAAASPYFKAMFTGGLKECENKNIKLEGVSPTAMKILIHFIYTGKLKVTENIVCQLLPAAAMFQVTNAIEACCDFLEKQLDPSNAIGIASFAENHGCLSLYRKANQYIERHFREVAQEEEFFQLNAVELVQLIRKDELNVQEEKEVYNAVLKWVEYDPERQNEMENILSAVRCQFLPPKFLNDQMINCKYIQQAPACKEYLAKIFKDLTLHKCTIEKERTPNIPRVIYVAGGYLRKSLDIVEGFNVDDKTWKKMDSLAMPRSGLGGAFLKGMFFAVGGRNTSPAQSYDSDWVERYNPVKDKWRVCSPMSVPRNRVGVAVLDGLLYAVGGSEGSKYLDSVECYDPETDKWTHVKPMHYKRLALGVAVVNRLLYAIGGYDGEYRLNSVECYHPENDEWTILRPMNIPRSGAGVAAINQFIFVIGGYNGVGQLDDVERYDTEKGEWTFVAPMKKARSALSVTVLDCKIYAIGGYDGTNFSKSVEIYDPIRNEWTEGVSLAAGRSGHASAVCYQPPSTNCC